MANTINSNIKAGFVKFTFTDEEGDIIASFKTNPTDPRLVTRCKKIGDFFMSVATKTVKPESTADMEAFENTVEDKFCELLGYDCKTSLFGRVAATDVMSDGRIFASHVLDAVIQKIGPEIQKRRRANIARHTMKYVK